ncbi:MAG TPA: c-type cytochrome [Candidatus Binataceae bacterium]|jgi:mono/diheme cytochrome c family protein|nr:c-type cytochrome [Candidatus Binataceae bacterium]
MLWIGAVLCGCLLLAPRRARAFPWSIDMFRGESVQPMARSPRVMPPGTLPVNGEPPMSREQSSAKLHNPLKADPAVLAAGKSLFESNCAVCHGNNARGNGTVRFLLRVPPADLTAGVAAQRTDGYIYATIRNGSIVMPSYADAMSSAERWQVVLFLRSLQGKVAAK